MKTQTSNQFVVFSFEKRNDNIFFLTLTYLILLKLKSGSKE